MQSTNLYARALVSMGHSGYLKLEIVCWIALRCACRGCLARCTFLHRDFFWAIPDIVGQSTISFHLYLRLSIPIITFDSALLLVTHPHPLRDTFFFSQYLLSTLIYSYQKRSARQQDASQSSRYCCLDERNRLSGSDNRYGTPSLPLSIADVMSFRYLLFKCSV